MVKLIPDQLFGGEGGDKIVDPDLIEGGLKSKQFATVVDLLGYGEIDGIFNPEVGTSKFRQNIFLDNTPIQNSNGDENFTNVDVFVKNGASDQTPIKEINAIEKTIPVGLSLTNSPFTTTQAATYTLSSGGQDVTIGGTTFTLGASQMVIIKENHGYSIGDVIHWENTQAEATEQSKFPQTTNILIENFNTDFFVVNTTFVGLSFQNGSCNIKTSQGLSRTISDTNVDKLRISIQVPALQEFKDDGEIDGAEVQISIRITENNGTVNNPVILEKINGRASSAYVQDFELVFFRDMNFPLTLTVMRNTADGTDPKLQNLTNWLSYTEMITDNSAYQGFAYVALRFNAQEFQSFPRRMYRVKGTKIKIPHNGTVDQNNGAIDYSGDFNGTFKADKEWSADPAWILYDLLTTDKGFGDKLNSNGSVAEKGIIDEETLDVFSFFQASKYASELVDAGNGDGTKEPRFSCNVIINRKNDAYTIINDLCSVMNAMPFYSVGSLTISQDRPTNTSDNTSDAQYIFTNANVTQQGFTYTGVGSKTKFTEVEVSYFDNETQQLDFHYVDANEITALETSGLDAITKFGRVRKTLKSFACTSRGQANRLARWFLYTNLLESETVSFTTTLEAGVIVRPQTIIGIADSMRAGVRRGGRINSVNDSQGDGNIDQIIVDDANNTDLTAENTATLSVVLPDGTVQSRSISSISDKTITVSSAFSAVPQANSIWAIENTSVEFQLYRVLGVEEVNHCEYKVTAIIHDVNKYSQVEDNTALPTRTITTLIDVKPAPSNLTATEQIVVLQNRAVSKIFVSWEPVLGVKEYLVEFQYSKPDSKNFDNPEKLRIARPTFELFEAREGTYLFKVQSYNALGKLSTDVSTFTFNAVGKTALPDDVQNLQIEPLSDLFVRLRFDKSTDVDVIHGGNVVIRSSNLTSGATFTNSVDVVPELSGNVTEAIVPNIVNGTYLLAFRDDGGRLSANAASIALIDTRPDIFPKLTVLTDREDLDNPPFQGTKDDCFFSDEVNGLVLGSTVTIDDEPDFDAIADFDFIGDVDFLTGGQYFFVNTLDLGSKHTLHLRRHFVTQGFLPNDLIDKRTANVDTWTDFDGTTATEVNAKLSVATTDSDPDLSVSATYAISATTITITKSSHGYSVGSLVTVDFTSGTGVDGDYIIQSVPNANTFTLTSATSLSTSGNCTYSAEFSQYNPFVNGAYVARGFKFKCDLLSTDPAQSIEIDQLGYSAELQSRTETSLGNAAASSGGFIASGTSTKSITFTNSFFTGQTGTSIGANSVLPSIGITIENAQSGDFFTLSNITGTGFDIDIKNGSSNVNRNFKYAATGFGRGS